MAGVDVELNIQNRQKEGAHQRRALLWRNSRVWTLQPSCLSAVATAREA